MPPRPFPLAGTRPGDRADVRQCACRQGFGQDALGRCREVQLQALPQPECRLQTGEALPDHGYLSPGEAVTEDELRVPRVAARAQIHVRPYKNVRQTYFKVDDFGLCNPESV